MNPAPKFAHASLLDALKAADAMLTRIMDGGSFPMFEYIERLYAIRSTIAKAERGEL